MKGDFTRSTFNTKKHYSKVNMQQGRVQMDADWNEQNDIHSHHERTFVNNLIGKYGTLKEDDGFRILGGNPEYKIKKGIYYVDGILCENEDDVTASEQLDLQMKPGEQVGDIQNPALPPSPPHETHYLAYLDVWDQHITNLEDPDIQETALGDVDTATRTKTSWQVKLIKVDPKYADNQCDMWKNIESNISQPTTGKIQARSKPTKDQNDKCDIYETAGYQKLENQLYRIEVHNPGLKDTCTFKWSRDNGIVVSKIIEFKPTTENKIIIAKRGKDDHLDFVQNDWIEITDDLHDMLNIPGTLTKIQSVVGNTITYYSDTVVGLEKITAANFDQHPKVRRWDHINEDPGRDPIKEGALVSNASAMDEGYVNLEWGVQIKVSTGYYRTGDYWQVPARTRTGKVEWPMDAVKTTDPLQQLPSGVIHHYAPLAILVHRPSGEFEFKADARRFFSSLTELVTMHYVGGDGQEASPGYDLKSPLRVAVTMGGTPIKESLIHGIKVKFTVNTGTGTLTEHDNGIPSETPAKILDVSTNNEGIAECSWNIGTSPAVQHIKAELYLCDMLMTEIPPIYFSASLPISFYYISGDGIEGPPGSTVELKVGVILGKEPVTSDYKVQFLLMPGETVLLEKEPDNQGNVALTYPLTGEPRQQVRAELLFLDNTKTNLPPIYFNIGLPQGSVTTTTSSNTGLARLSIPPNTPNIPLVFGPFSHFLEVMKPPAILLGLPNLEGIDSEVEKIILTEDSPDFPQGLFKPIDITRKNFSIKLYGVYTKEIILRWWAIPAEEQRRQSGKPGRSIGFDRDEYTREDTAILRVIDPQLTVNNQVIKVFVTTRRSEIPNVVEVDLRREPGTTNVYKGNVTLLYNPQIRELRANNIPISVGVNISTKLEIIATYKYNDANGPSQSVDDIAMMLLE
jgi:hypothetical protein